jgi:prepilin-type N-terminal cleavage/methylation domain-containing protein
MRRTRAGERGVGLVELMVVVAIMSVVGLLGYLILKGSMDSLDVIQGVDRIEAGGYQVLAVLDREVGISAVSRTAVDTGSDPQGDRITYQVPLSPSASSPSPLGVDSVIGNWATLLVVQKGTAAAPNWTLVRRVTTGANATGAQVGQDRVLASFIDAPSGGVKGFTARLVPAAQVTGATGTYLSVTARFAVLNPTDANKRQVSASVVLQN